MLIGELVIAIAQLAVFAVTAGLLVIELTFSLAAIALEVLLGAFGAAQKREAAPPTEERVGAPSPAAHAKRRKWVRTGGIISVAALLITVGTLVLLNMFMFESSVRWILEQARQRTGTQVTFTAASGNLFTGRLELSDVTLTRSQHSATVFDLRAEKLLVDLDMTSLLASERRVERTEVAGLAGTVERVGKSQTPWYARKNTRIEDLSIDGADLDWTDSTRSDKPLQLKASIQQLESKQLRSQWLAFDLLFRTNASGQIAQHPFLISNEKQGIQRLTKWHFSELSANVVADFVGGPFAWIDAAQIDIAADTSWLEDDQADLQMKWQFDLRNVRATAPADLQGIAGRLSQVAVGYINEHSAHFPLAFELTFDREGFVGSASPETAGLGRAVGDAALVELAKLLHLDRDEAVDLADKALQRLKALRARRSATQPADASP